MSHSHTTILERSSQSSFGDDPLSDCEDSFSVSLSSGGTSDSPRSVLISRGEREYGESLSGSVNDEFAPISLWTASIFVNHSGRGFFFSGANQNTKFLASP